MVYFGYYVMLVTGGGAIPTVMESTCNFFLTTNKCDLWPSVWQKSCHLSSILKVWIDFQVLQLGMSLVTEIISVASEQKDRAAASAMHVGGITIM